jgi:hypothetical protein
MNLHILIGTENRRVLGAIAKKRFPNHFHLSSSLVPSPKELEVKLKFFGWNGSQDVCLSGDSSLKDWKPMLDQYKTHWHMVDEVPKKATQVPVKKTIPKKKLGKVAPGEYTLDSFCSVATKEMKKECLLLIRTIRLFHKQPIYLFTDTETRDFLEESGVENVYIRVEVNPDQLDQVQSAVEVVVKKQNDFHRSDVISKKMDVMDYALSEQNSTMFLDSDIIFINPIPETYDTELALSPHYYPAHNKHKQETFGVYNAGYVFCANKTFPKYWKKLYFTRSNFYEQQCMEYFEENYSVSLFPENHNVGIWREETLQSLKEMSPITIHCHFDSNIDYKGLTYLQTRAENLCLITRELLKRKFSTKVLEVVVEIFGESKSRPKKIAFVHFGKAAGIYVIKYLQRNCLEGFKNYNSWNYGWKRDFTESELFEIAETDEEYAFVHNHHLGWTKEAILKFTQEGWTIFTFLRDPRDLICSLYFWAKDKGVEIRPGLPHPETLDEFFDLAVHDKALRELWTIPYHVIQYDFVREFNDNTFDELLSLYWGAEHKPLERFNISSNKGFRHYLATGELSQAKYQRLLKDKEYKRYTEFIKLEN